MKKRTKIIIGIAIVVLLVCYILIMTKPYKVTTFVADGENYSAEVVDDGALILNIRNRNESGEWTVESFPEMFAADYITSLDDGAELHIIPLSEGKGEMAIHFTADDGTVEKYILSLTVSRHKKIYLQIDSVSFGEYQ